MKAPMINEKAESKKSSGRRQTYSKIIQNIDIKPLLPFALCPLPSAVCLNGDSEKTA